MGWTQYVVPIVTGIAGIVSGIRDVKKNEKIKWYTYFLIGTTLIILGFDIFNRKSDSTDANSKHQELKDSIARSRDSVITHEDSNAKDILSQSREDTDTLLHQGFSTLKKIDTLAIEIKKGKPNYPDVIDLAPYPEVDIVFTLHPTASDDILNPSILLSNKGGTIYNIRYEATSITQLKGKLYVEATKLKYKLDETKTLSKDSHPIECYGQIPLLHRSYDTMYFKIDLFYSNRSGKEYPRDIKVFRFSASELNVPLQRASSPKYVEIKQFLIDQKQW